MSKIREGYFICDFCIADGDGIGSPVNPVDYYGDDIYMHPECEIKAIQVIMRKKEAARKAEYELEETQLNPCVTIYVDETDKLHSFETHQKRRI